MPLGALVELRDEVRKGRDDRLVILPHSAREAGPEGAVFLDRELRAMEHRRHLFSRREAVLESPEGILELLHARALDEPAWLRHPVEDVRDAGEDLRHTPVGERAGDQADDLSVVVILVIVEELQRIGLDVIAPVELRIECIQLSF